MNKADYILQVWWHYIIPLDCSVDPSDQIKFILKFTVTAVSHLFIYKDILSGKFEKGATH